jgi:hypothetical protein
MPLNFQNLCQAYHAKANGTYKLSEEQMNDKGVWWKIAGGGGRHSENSVP